jgi:hypothetical protein
MNQQNKNLNRAEKIAKVEKFFSQLFCFTADESLTYSRAVQNFPDEGVDEFLKTLEEGKKRQDSFLANQIEKDGLFVNKMDKFLGKKTKKLKDEYETRESKKAERFLQNL